MTPVPSTFVSKVGLTVTLCGCLISMGCSQPVPARFRVVDADTGTPLSGVRVENQGASGSILHNDRDLLRRIGYTDLSGEIFVHNVSEFHVNNVSFDLCGYDGALLVWRPDDGICYILNAAPTSQATTRPADLDDIDIHSEVTIPIHRQNPVPGGQRGGQMRRSPLSFPAPTTRP